MKYMAWLEIDNGSHAPAGLTERYLHGGDAGPIWTVALGRPLLELSGMVAEKAEPLLDDALRYLRDPDHWDDLLALESKDGGVTVSSASHFLEMLLLVCDIHPGAIVRITKNESHTSV